jgi:hypothetical protein
LFEGKGLKRQGTLPVLTTDNVNWGTTPMSYVRDVAATSTVRLASEHATGFPPVWGADGVTDEEAESVRLSSTLFSPVSGGLLVADPADLRRMMATGTRMKTSSPTSVTSAMAVRRLAARGWA